MATVKIDKAKESAKGQYICYVFPEDRLSFDTATVDIEIGEVKLCCVI